MENSADAFRYLAAAIAVFPLLGVGFAVGRIFVELISTIGKNPSSKDQVYSVGMVGFAVTEAVALFCVLIAILILYR